MHETTVLQTAESLPTDTPIAASSDALAPSAVSDVTMLESALSNSETTTTETTSTPPDYDSWLNKPIDDYTPTEGMLLLLVTIAIAALVAKIFDLI